MTGNNAIQVFTLSPEMHSETPNKFSNSEGFAVSSQVLNASQVADQFEEPDPSSELEGFFTSSPL